MKNKLLVILTMVLFLVLAAGCASTTGVTKPEPAGTGLTLKAVKTESAPAIDGAADDGAWDKAPETVVSLTAEPGVEPRKIALKAVYDNERVYLLASYEDSTPLKIGEAWAFDGASWTKGAYDDTLAFLWEMGDFPGFSEKGMDVMTTPLKNGLDVFDFRIDSPGENELAGHLDFWGW